MEWNNFSLDRIFDILITPSLQFACDLILLKSVGCGVAIRSGATFGTLVVNILGGCVQIL